jgi:hypothetical protein
MTDDDPRSIRSIAVSAEDLTAALQANRTDGGGAVLRVTPPFSGRMRARIHREGASGGYDGDPRPVHVDPEALVEGAPPFPDPDDTEDELRADPDAEYTPDRHRRRHVERVEAWREAVRESAVDAVDLDLPDGRHHVAVTLLG